MRQLDKTLDLPRFFSAVRTKLYSGRLPEYARLGVESLLEACLAEGVHDAHHVSNVLAQATRETGGYMLPVKETVYRSSKNKNPSDATVIGRLNKAYAQGKLKGVRTKYWLDGAFGRGQIQLTHWDNYVKMGRRLGVDLRGKPELMLDVEISSRATVVGMKEGLFRAKKLSDYSFPSDLDAPQARNPRRIVNGNDGSDAEVARTHRAYHAALTDAGWRVEPAARAAPPATGVGATVPVPTPRPEPELDDDEDEEVEMQDAPEPPKEIDVPDFVRLVQNQLRAKGYPEVGLADGVVGSRTRDAIVIFQRNAGLPLDGLVTSELLEALVVAAPRVVGEVRANATAADLKTAEGVKIGGTLRNVGSVVAVAGILGGVVDGSTSFEQLAAHAGAFEVVVATLRGLGPWTLAATLGLAAAWLGRRQIADQVRKFRDGRHV